MQSSARFAAISLILLILGCKGAQTTPSESGSEGAVSSFFSSASGSSAMKTEYIKDPTLNNMNAASVKLPARWIFQGMLFQGGTCAPIPTPVFRATSPDGLSYVESFPLMAWKSVSGSLQRYAQQDDCLQLSTNISAQQFLRVEARTLGAKYVQDEPVPGELVQQAQQALRSSGGGNTKRELARAIVLLKNGSFILKARLGTMVDCTVTVIPGQKSYLRGIADVPASTINKCMAKLYLYAAPEKQYDAMIRTWDAPGMGATQLMDWAQAWLRRKQEETAKAVHDISVKGEHDRQMIHDQYQHNMEVSARQHQEFMQAMQARTDASMNSAWDKMNQRANFTSDVVDYALDRRTTVNPSTGDLVRVSNQANVVWGNTQGDVFASKDPNADPRGILPGDWSPQDFTHGNGAPMQ